MKNDYEHIKLTVKRLKEDYGFKGLLHFTDFSNLGSIINNGYLHSRNYCYEHNIDFLDIEDNEVIQHNVIDVNNCTRFYFNEKNNVLNGAEGIKEEGKKPHIPIPVYLVFDEELIYFDTSFFSDGNADSIYTNFGTDFDFFNYEINWDVIFKKDIIPEDIDGPVKWAFERKQHAELLCTEPVSLKYLKRIIFRSNTDYKRACSLFGKSKLYIVDSNMFYSEKNYIKDYSIVFDKIKDKGVFLLHFSTNIPVKNVNTHEFRLYDLNDNLLQKNKTVYSESTGTEFILEVDKLPILPVKFQFWFYGILSIEEVIG